MGACVRCRCVHPFPSRFRLTTVLVEFDIDAGPTVDALYPPLTLRPAEIETLYTPYIISVQASNCVTEHFVHSRTRCNSTKGSNAFIPHTRTNKHIPRLRERPVSEDGFIYGFSYFIQRRDTSKRGYQQVDLLFDHELLYSFFSAIPRHVDEIPISIPIFLHHQPLRSSI
jgi:hypothetical protein